MEHQFRVAGCSQPARQCIYQHQPDQLGRFADVKNAAGTRACTVLGKLGSCSQGAIFPDAHMDVPGARGQLAGSRNMCAVCLCCNAAAIGRMCGGSGGGGDSNSGGEGEGEHSAGERVHSASEIEHSASREEHNEGRTEHNGEGEGAREHNASEKGHSEGEREHNASAREGESDGELSLWIALTWLRR